VKPALGRLFTSEEDTGGSSRVALLGHALWAERFGSSASIVGRTIRLDDEPYLVVGVLPPGFHPFDPDDELWLPLGLPPAQLANHDSHYLRVLGRLKPGVTLAQAQADLDTIAARLTAQYPLSNGGVGVTVTSLREQTVGDVRLPLLILLGVTGLLLLMVCANIGNLLIARASSRAREFALRAAVGATRARLVRQMLAESALLAAIGGGLGLALAAWGVSMLRWLAPSSLPRVADVGLNAPVAGVDIALTLVAGVLCGLMPAWQSRDDLHDTLRDESRGSATRARLRAGNVLVVVETGLGVVVLVGAGLLLRSFLQLTRVPVGFEPRGVLTLRVSLPPARYTALSARAAFYTDVAERLRALPGARSAAGISFLPLTMQGRTTGLAIEGDSTASVARFADFRSVTPGYFASMSIPLVAGRDVAWTDTPASPLAVVVSETLARTFWPGQDPLGRRLKLGRPGDDVPWLTVIGVVGDVRLLDLLRPSRPAMYFPALQDQGIGDTVRDWVVRTATTDPTSLAGAVRRVVWAVDPALPVTEVRTMGEIRSAATASQRFNLLLVGLFAALALVLAAVGVYGVTAHGVAQRTRELGIRIALGARRGALLRLVLGHGAGLAAAGLVLGAAIALALSRLLSALLFGVGARDPLTFVTVSLVLLAVSLAASFVPAWRATSVDPVTALRV
jgi:putative ABC transport system permease protein